MNINTGYKPEIVDSRGTIPIDGMYKKQIYSDIYTFHISVLVEVEVPFLYGPLKILLPIIHNLLF